MNNSPRLDSLEQAMKLNAIINGGFDFWQRGTSLADDSYGADRWYLSQNGDMVATQDRIEDVPTWSRSTYSKRINITASDTLLDGSNNLHLRQRVEGLIGSSLIGEEVEISFSVKTNKIGQYTVALIDGASSKSIKKSYTVTTTGAWEKYSISLNLNEATAIFNKDNSICFQLYFSLGASPTFTSSNEGVWETGAIFNVSGSENLSDTIGNYWQVSDVMVTKKSEDENYEPEFVRAGRNYVEESNLCYRYYWRIIADNQGAIAHGISFSSPNNQGSVSLTSIVSMRVANPIASLNGSWQCFGPPTVRNITSLGACRNYNGVLEFRVNADGTFNGADAMSLYSGTASVNNWLQFDAEL